MDRNSILSMLINASFVRSLLSSFFGLFKMNRLTSGDGGGPINFLPNEMMQLILTKLELEGDVRKLIRLRLVSTKWRSLVEDYCAQKKSLCVRVCTSRPYGLYHSPSNFKTIFLGLANLRHFTRLFVSDKISSVYLQSLLNLFPNVVQLSTICEDEGLMRDFVVYVNSLDSLKVLDFCRPFVSVQSSLFPTLAKLEHVSFGCHGQWGRVSYNNINPIQSSTISHFGPSCVRVCFGGYFDYEQVLQWHNINASWLANLTHLQMVIDNYDRDTQFFVTRSKVVHYLGEHAISLKHLSLRVWANQLMMTPAVIGSLGKLRHLANLELWNIEMDISVLGQAAAHRALSSLSSVLTCKLYLFVRPTTGDQFTRVFSGIFPNLVDLDLDLFFRGKFLSLFTQHVERHLYRFRNLRKHKLVYTDEKIWLANR